MNSLVPTLPELDPDGQRLPIKLDSTSNGEFAPVPLDASLRHANQVAREWAGDLARKLGALDFFVKPIDCEKLLKRINEIMTSPKTNGPAPAQP